MKNLLQRSLTGIVFVTVVIGSILWHPMAFGAVMLIVSLLGLDEFVNITSNEHFSQNKWLTLVLGAMVFVILYLAGSSNEPLKMMLWIFPTLFLVPIFELFRTQKNVVGNVAITIFSILYIVLPLGLLTFLHIKNTLLLYFFLLLWSSDTFAYIFGISFGKHKMFERVSPKKSWEGFIGGLLCTIGISILLNHYFPIFENLWFAVGMALIIVVFGVLGDLIESLIKRSLNIKDSGNILPGHGGILDRFDAVFIAAPFAIAYLYLFHIL